PSGQTVCQGSLASFSVAATGISMTYQWKKNGTSLTNTGNISGATSSALTINPTGLSDASSSYAVVISSTCHPDVVSDPAALNIDSTSVGGSISGTTTVCSGSNSGTLTLSGQTGSVVMWQFSTNGGTSYSNISNTTVSF